jgi:hypothetical protein
MSSRKATDLPEKNVLISYWLPSVGIGPGTPPPAVLDGDQRVQIPLTDVLNYKRSDGSYQINVVNLVGGNFTYRNSDEAFSPPYLTFDEGLQQVLSDGSVKKLQAAGIKVVLTVMGFGNGHYGWSSLPTESIESFVSYLNESILDEELGYGLDGIDIDDEYARSGDNLTAVVQSMHCTFPPNKIISKALWNDCDVIAEIKDCLSYGCLMRYGNRVEVLQADYEIYLEKGMRHEQLLMGVNAGPVEQTTYFTSLEATRELAAWRPSKGRDKRGMMMWTFSQDIQQFTAFPQNQVALKFPCAEDHLWQRTIVEVFEAAAREDQQRGGHGHGHLRGPDPAPIYADRNEDEG